MPSDKLTELGIRKSKSGKKEKKLHSPVHPNLQNQSGKQVQSMPQLKTKLE